MNQYSDVSTATSCHEQAFPDIGKGKRDTIILRYMARRLHLTLHQFTSSDSGRRTHPIVYTLQERRERMHRIAIYQPRELLVKTPLSFVGFLSRKQRQLPLSLLKTIERVDKQMVEDLAETPGILSYTSLELAHGEWCNLVVLDNAGTKSSITGRKLHKYAAYSLAPAYYEWIRLHHGILPEGLDHMEMQLQKTRYYTFSGTQAPPSIQERVYPTVGQGAPLVAPPTIDPSFTSTSDFAMHAAMQGGR